MLLFGLEPDAAFAGRVAQRCGCSVAPLEERPFGHGEHKMRPLVNVAGRDVYVVHSLHGEAGLSANDKLVRLLFFIGALKDAGATRVTAITPYLAYSRKDRRTKPQDPVSTRYTAMLFEAVSTDRIVTVEVHNLSAFENAFRSCRPEHVPVAALFASYVATMVGEQPIAVISPDAGGDKRAELFRRTLETLSGRAVDKAIMDKHRSKGVVSGSLLAGNVAGKTAIIVDDLISSGTTIVRAARTCREAGATRVIAVAAHAMFPADAPLFGADGPDQLLVTDTVPLPEGLATAARDKIGIVSVAELVGDVIVNLHAGRAVSDLLPYD